MKSGGVISVRVSFSQIGTFEQCPYKWKLHYIDELQTIIPKEPTDPLVLGNALHTALEHRDIEPGLRYYREHMPIGSDLTANEEIKLTHMVRAGLDIIPDGIHELPLDVPGEFKGFIDLLVPSGEPDTFHMVDYKYANPKNVEKYRDSAQLSVYKYYFERLHPGKKIDKMCFVLFPKVAIRQKKTETLEQFRNRLRGELEGKEPIVIPVEYDREKVEDFLAKKAMLERAREYPKNESTLCDWCDYSDYCRKGELTMMLPKAERVNRAQSDKIKMWIYGDPFSGKTTFANAAPMPLMLNTDGNVKFVDAPAVPIRDHLEKDGRMTKKVFGWATFKEMIDELEKDPQGFQTVVLDLVEGLYELCRTYMYDKRGWEHESDDSYKAWDIVRKEYLDTMRRVTNLPMNVILISHEDTTRDFTKPGGDKVTAIKPNISEKIAKQLAGMVDIVGRASVRKDRYTLSFKTDESMFGGGRVELVEKEIDLDWDKFTGVFFAAKGQKAKPEETPKRKERKPKPEPEPEQQPDPEPEVMETETPPFDPDPPKALDEPVPGATDEGGEKPRRRRKRS